MATIGRTRAIAEFKGIKMSGFFCLDHVACGSYIILSWYAQPYFCRSQLVLGILYMVYGSENNYTETLFGDFG